MSSYPLFSVAGIEIEYMLVDDNTLEIAPKSDVMIEKLAGTVVNEIGLGEIALSNELVMHVIELKNNGPKSLETDINTHFQEALNHLQPLLKEQQLLLLPTGAHPWMNPEKETKRWPYDNHEIYQSYDRIFDCKGHGWSNLQSMHVNLPFASNEEFYQLHNLIRLILPLIPALAASTPFLDSQQTGYKDTRLIYYGQNQSRIPSISGEVIPDFAHSIGQYQTDVLKPMYQAISQHDSKGILQHEWLNSRGAIPKFEMGAIEIRVIDSQECVDADIAIAKAVIAVLRYWHSQSTYYLSRPCETARLKSVYQEACKYGLCFEIDDGVLAKQWLLPSRKMQASALWSQLIEKASSYLTTKEQKHVEFILSEGNLSERLLKSVTKRPMNHQVLHEEYKKLATCLQTNQRYQA